MTTSPSAILAELYEIDPGLREHEAELVPLITKLLEHDPAQKPSPAFVKKLRNELKARATSIESGAVEHRVSFAGPSAFTMFFHRFAYAAAGAVAAVIIAVPVTLEYVGNRTLPPTDATGTTLQKDASAETGTPTAPASNNAVGMQAYGRGQGGGGGGDASMGALSSIIAPWNPLKYKIEGDLPALPQSDVTVLERNLRPMSVPFSSVQGAFNDVAMDLSSFSDATVETITLAQHKPYGYFINVSLTDGSVSINQAWDQWPHPENNCTDDACFRNLQPKLSDIPADDAVIDIANAFLKDYDINVDGYGVPMVDHAWRIQYESVAYIPESIRVIYPLIVDGQTVYETSGDAAGISVQVSIKHKRVTDVWGLTNYAFTKSSHAPVSETSTIEDFLGQSGSQTPDAPTATLTNPTLGLMRLYTYERNASHELYIPAIIFQVTNVPSTIGYYQHTVAVPLAKDLLDQASPPIQIDPMPRPVDLPLMNEKTQ